MKKQLLLASLIIMGSAAVNAQGTIRTETSKNYNHANTKLNLSALEQQLASGSSRRSRDFVVSIPNARLKQEKFILIERDILTPKLKEKLPHLKSFYGYSTTNPSKKISLGYSSKGINAIIYDEQEKYIIEKQNGAYFLKDSKNFPDLENFNCGTESLNNESLLKKARNTNENSQFNNPPFYRKYRLAIATDYSYNAYFAKEGEEPTLEDSFAAVNETLTYILPIYENDLSISFQLVDDADKITFLTEESNPYNPESNPYNSESEKEDLLLKQNQEQLDEKIGSENYDLGLLFTNAIGGGNAGYIGTVCNNSKKGSAYMGYLYGSNHESFTFSSYVAHEIGHQFGANHTHSRNEGFGANREIGSGVTLMGYAGVTRTHDVIDNHIPKFHNYNLYQINNYLATQSCGIHTRSSNTPPIANAGKDYNIPKGTAYKLIGSASDLDNDNLTYSWEQDNALVTPANGLAFISPGRYNTEGANFRIYEDSTNPEHYFPPLENVLNGQLYSTWNTVSDISRELNFVFHVRDNQIGGGQIASDKTKVNVTDDGPFKINNIFLNQSFNIGETFTLKWDVAGTNTGEINTQNVRIKLTTDDGKTFTTLVESTPNNGNATIHLPNDLRAEKANIIIEAIDNIYYAASNYIAIGYQVSLDCKEYINKQPLHFPTSVANIGEEEFFTLSIADENRLIEDISMITDVNTSQGQIYVAIKNENTETDFYNTFYSGNCSNPHVKFKFNEFGENIFNICDRTSDTPIEFTVLENYKGKPANRDFNFLFYVAESQPVTVNKLGVELCFRETTTLNTSDFTKQNELFMYPNPTNGTFKIRITTKTNKIITEIMNMAGQTVLTKQFNSTGNNLEQAIDATHLPKGVYIVKITDGNDVQTKKLIIK